MLRRLLEGIWARLRWIRLLRWSSGCVRLLGELLALRGRWLSVAWHVVLIRRFVPVVTTMQLRNVIRRQQFFSSTDDTALRSDDCAAQRRPSQRQKAFRSLLGHIEETAYKDIQLSWRLTLQKGCLQQIYLPIPSAAGRADTH